MHYMVHYNQTQIDFIVPNILTLQSSNTLTLISLIEEINNIISSTTLTTQLINSFKSSTVNFSIDNNDMIKFNFNNCTNPPILLSTNLSKILGFFGNENTTSTYDLYTDTFDYKVYNGFINAYSFSQIIFSPIYYSLYFSNIPVKSHNADGSNTTFKIPCTISRLVPKISTLSNIFYNEQSNYKQTIYLEDKNFILNSLNVNLYDNTNQIIKLNTNLNYSFSLEIEYESYF